MRRTSAGRACFRLSSVPGYRVIEEGLSGRTTNLDDIIELDRNGLTYLAPCLESHAPIDLVTIMLGTNDLKARFNRNASDIAQSAGLLANIARSMRVGPDDGPPKVLLMAPPVVVGLTGLRRDVCWRDREVAAVRTLLRDLGREQSRSVPGRGQRNRQQPDRRHPH